MHSKAAKAGFVTVEFSIISWRGRVRETCRSSIAQDGRDSGRYQRASVQNETQSSNSAGFLANFSATRDSSHHISPCHNSTSWAAFHQSGHAPIRARESEYGQK